MTIKLIILSYQSGQRKESLALTNPSIQFQLDNFSLPIVYQRSQSNKKFAFSITTAYFDGASKHLISPSVK